MLEDIFSVISSQAFMAMFYICHFIKFEASNRIFYIEIFNNMCIFSYTHKYNIYTCINIREVAPPYHISF
jgi:hypothetical protein